MTYSRLHDSNEACFCIGGRYISKDIAYVEPLPVLSSIGMTDVNVT